jgi:hypothetical protein
MIVHSRNEEDLIARKNGPLGGGPFAEDCEWRMSCSAASTSHGAIGPQAVCPQLYFAGGTHSEPTEVGGQG